jgi:hypothetical protein
VVNAEQCTSESGLMGTDISGKCDLYNGLCKMKCSEFLSASECPSGEDGYCFWLEGTTSLDGTCVAKVCYKLVTLIFFFFLYELTFNFFFK